MIQDFFDFFHSASQQVYIIYIYKYLTLSVLSHIKPYLLPSNHSSAFKFTYQIDIRGIKSVTKKSESFPLES